MKAEYIQPGHNLDYINTTEETIDAGSIVTIGAIAAVAATIIEPGEVGAVATEGVWRLPKDAGAIAAGVKVYYNTATDATTADTSVKVDTEDGKKETVTLVPLGTAVVDAGADDACVCVKLNA